MVAADVYRPAAIEQLQVLGGQIGVEVFTIAGSLDPVDIALTSLTYAKENDFDTVLIDTAGRQAIDEKLMAELVEIKKAVKADESLLVVDSLMGQEAASLTKTFNDAIGLTGAILTKTDGDSRGGSALSVNAVSGKPIKFVGTGEKIADLEVFYPVSGASGVATDFDRQHRTNYYCSRIASLKRFWEWETLSGE